MITEFVPTDERTGARFPLMLTTGRILSQYNVGAQTRAHAEQPVARRGRAGDPSVRRREPRHPRRRSRAAAEPLRRDRAARADLRAHAARRRLHHVPPRRAPAPTWSPPTTPTGRPTARSTRSPPCRCRAPAASASGSRKTASATSSCGGSSGGRPVSRAERLAPGSPQPLWERVYPASSCPLWDSSPGRTRCSLRKRSARGVEPAPTQGRNAMKLEKLTRMANEIARNLRSQPGDQAVGCYRRAHPQFLDARHARQPDRARKQWRRRSGSDGASGAARAGQVGVPVAPGGALIRASDDWK